MKQLLIIFIAVSTVLCNTPVKRRVFRIVDGKTYTQSVPVEKNINYFEKRVDK